MIPTIFREIPNLPEADKYMLISVETEQELDELIDIMNKETVLYEKEGDETISFREFKKLQNPTEKRKRGRPRKKHTGKFTTTYCIHDHDNYKVVVTLRPIHKIVATDKIRNKQYVFEGSGLLEDFITYFRSIEEEL